MEISPAGEKAQIFGSFLDNWRIPLVDIGPTGEEEGPVPNISFVWTKTADQILASIARYAQRMTLVPASDL